MEDSSNLEVKWKVGYPPVRPSGLKDLKVSGTSEGDDYDLEVKLGWPRGTLAVLNAAFRQGLSRYTGWKTDRPNMAMRKAARVFRRGVALQSEDDPVEKSGKYAIKFISEKPLFQRRAREWFIVDSKVLYHWPELKELDPFVIDASEQKKNLTTVAQVLEAWRGRLKPAKWTIIGGGIVADLAAFAASEAEAKFTFAPTTLLAMVDACIGGKTGVNLPPFGKNQVGSFYFPDEVIIWPGWLHTLPRRQLNAGGGECLKHAFLMGDYESGHGVAEALRHQQIDQLTPYLHRLVKFKVDIIAEDPTEQGRRIILNLGHTLAHALEALAIEATKGDITILHGEAVAIGLGFCNLLSSMIADLPQEELEKMWHLLSRAKLLISEKELEHHLGFSDLRSDVFMEKLLLAIGTDKKKDGDRTDSSRFILLRRLGEVFSTSPGQFTAEISHDLIRKLWVELLDRLPRN